MEEDERPIADATEHSDWSQITDVLMLFCFGFFPLVMRLRVPMLSCAKGIA